MRTFAIVAGGLVAIVLGAAIVLALWIRTSSGHAFVKGELESFVASELRGSLRIDEIDEVAPGRLHGRGVRFLSPEGHSVLIANDVTLHLSWLDVLLHQRFHVDRADVHGGRMRLVASRDGSLDLDRTFSNRSSAPPNPQSPPPVDFEAIHFDDVVLDMGGPGVPDAKATRLGGMVRAWVPFEGAPVRLDARSLHGRVAIDTPVPLELRIARGRLAFDGAKRQRAELDVHGELQGARVHLATKILSIRRGTHVSSVLTVASLGGAARALPAIVQGSLADLLSPGFELSVRIGAS